MPRPASSTLKTTSKPGLKNPLRASTMPLLAPSTVSEEPGSPGRAAAAPGVTAQQLRRMQISEFSAWLRTQTNKHKRPFQEETILLEQPEEQVRPVGRHLGRGRRRRDVLSASD
jgi:hypothetical protein